MIYLVGIIVLALNVLFKTNHSKIFTANLLGMINAINSDEGNISKDGILIHHKWAN